MIAFCTTCRGRAQHIKETLPRNLADNKKAKFIILDYGSPDDLVPYLLKEHWRDIVRGRLIVYQFQADAFHMSHAKNMVHRCAIREGADILVTVDADNFAGKDFDRFVEENIEVRTFLCPDFPRIKSLPHGPLRPQRGYAGRLAIRVQDFLKVGGYDETFDTWRGEDIDIIARLNRTGGYTMRHIPNNFLNAIPHGSEIRFREYPHAKQYETKGEFGRISNRKETVVNFGKIGCGKVTRNFFSSVELDAVPTRIFGIGMQKTATTSLHQAFKILGYDSFHWETNRKAWRVFEEVSRLGRSPLLEQYYSLCDNPIPMLYKQLDAAYPGSKFILTTREESNWLKSAKGLFDPKVNPWYDWDKQPFSHRIHEALYGRRDFHAATFLERYRRHNAEVTEYFKGRLGDFLVMDMDFGWPMPHDGGCGWPELCGFLNKPIPKVPYPRAYTEY